MSVEYNHNGNKGNGNGSSAEYSISVEHRHYHYYTILGRMSNELVNRAGYDSAKLIGQQHEWDDVEEKMV